MKLKRKNPELSNEDIVDELENEIPKRKIRRKRTIIESDSSSSEDEEDIPLAQRQNIKAMLSQARNNNKKRNNFNLTQDKLSEKPKNQKTPAAALLNSSKKSKKVPEPVKPKTDSSNNDGFKKPMIPPPPPPPPVSDGGFKAPLPPQQSGGFVAPMPMLSQGQQNNLLSSRLSHYVSSICSDLEEYNETKARITDSLLSFPFAEDLPTLDMEVMRKFTQLSYKVITEGNMESIDNEQYGKVIRLMENLVIGTSDMDIIEEFSKKYEKSIQQCQTLLSTIHDAFETAVMMVNLAVTCKLDKKIFSQDQLLSCLHFIKNHLYFIVYPIIDLDGFEDDPTATKTLPTLSISKLIPFAANFLRKILDLVQNEEYNDNTIVVLAYICIAPFFHEFRENSTSILLAGEKPDSIFNSYEQLKLYALDILKRLFAKYAHHRRWILEEILSSLGTLSEVHTKKRYQLRANRSVHVTTAIFMQLVQSCSTVSSVTSHKNWLRKWDIKHQRAVKKEDAEMIKQLDDKLVKRASSAWKMGYDAATNNASFILEVLMSKCKSRKSDSYAVPEYRALLERTLEDILLVLNEPEWPVAETFMRVFSRLLVSFLEGDHSDVYLKSLGIEWLGKLVCKIKMGFNQLAGQSSTFTPEWICDLNEKLPMSIKNNTPIEQIALLDQCRMKLYDYLVKERPTNNALQYYLCNWGFVESVVWTKANIGWEMKKKVAEKDEEDHTNNNENDAIDMKEISNVINELDESSKWPEETERMLRITCNNYWMICLGYEDKLPEANNSYPFPVMSRYEYNLLAEMLASRQTLYTSFNFIVSELLICLDKEAVTYRAKTLRALGKAAQIVPEILDEGNIRSAVFKCIHDSSPTVRDAAVGVVAKYLGSQDNIPIPLYEAVSGRIMDTSLSVRKKLVNLLRELFNKFSDIDIKMDIASKLILRINDNEITISELALKATQEVLFKPFKEIENNGADYFGYTYENSPKDRKINITRLAGIITGAVSKIDTAMSSQNAALSLIIQKTLEIADEKTKVWYEKIFQWIVDSLFDQMMILDEDDKSQEFITCLSTVYSFTKSLPNLLRKTQITMLQPYLSARTPEDWIKARYVLTIYRDVIPRKKYLDDDFINMVERIVMQIVGKCPLDTVSIATACLCGIVDRISQKYNILIKMLGSCVEKLRAVRRLIENGNLPNTAMVNVLKLLMLCGLLCQHFDFNQKRENEPLEMEALNLVYKGDIDVLVYDILQFFTMDHSEVLKEHSLLLRTTALQGLGYFFASYPIYMISPTSTALIDEIFKVGSIQLKIQLMKVFQEFLAAEEVRIDKRKERDGQALHTKIIDVDTLLGNTVEYAELGVNGSLMQRYLHKILRCALDDSIELRFAGFEVVSAIVHQGLAYPFICMSAIVSAETSPDVVFRTKAYYLHRHLHDKYGDLLYSHMDDYIESAYEYQVTLSGKGLFGYGRRGGDSKTEALLGLAYSILKEKKKSKFIFYKSLVKPFSFDFKSATPEEVDLSYLKFLAENILTLDFASTGEVLSVVHSMNRAIVTNGDDLLSYIEYLKKQGVIKEAETIDEDEDIESINTIDNDFILATKSAMSMIMLIHVKDMLVELYDIPDDEIASYDHNNTKKGRDVTKD
ncbi:hypothetical protein K501DRAFT_319711, partial [Backusella circina FSU 941]